MEKIKLTKIFNNESFGAITTFVDENNNTWFIGNEIAEKLGYSDCRKAVYENVDDFAKRHFSKKELKIMYKNNNIENYKEINNRGAILITEPGIYALTFNSKLPLAKKFREWIFGEVLPVLRKTGAYFTDETAQAIKEGKITHQEVFEKSEGAKEEIRTMMKALGQAKKEIIKLKDKEKLLLESNDKGYYHYLDLLYIAKQLCCIEYGFDFKKVIIKKTTFDNILISKGYCKRRFYADQNKEVLEPTRLFDDLVSEYSDDDYDSSYLIDYSKDDTSMSGRVFNFQIASKIISILIKDITINDFICKYEDYNSKFNKIKNKFK